VKSRSLVPVSDYHLAGKHTKVIFVTGGPDDGMRLSYNDKLYEGSALCSEATEFGQMVSVVLECLPDVRTTVLTVAVPEGHRPSEMRSIGIHTFAVITTTKTSVSGSPLVSGQIREYEVVLLHGNAW
jgi:hypothetical protein